MTGRVVTLWEGGYLRLDRTDDYETGPVPAGGMASRSAAPHVPLLRKSRPLMYNPCGRKVKKNLRNS